MALPSAIVAITVGTSNARMLMLIHPDLQGARPLMVVGGPRCGTRFVANALNCHPAILVLGEIPRPVMDNAVRFLSETGGFFASERQWSVSWERSRRDLLFEIWASMIKGTPRVPKAKIAWFGHKTPQHERYWKFYQEFFGDVGPKYVFCMRNFVDHFLSISSMNDQHAIDHIARKYRASVTRYAQMKAELGESVSLFILDDLREGGIDYVRETLFERLGIDVDDRTLSRIDVSRQANSTEGAGRSRRRELTADERDFVERNQDLTEALHALRAARPLEPRSEGGERLLATGRRSFAGIRTYLLWAMPFARARSGRGRPRPTHGAAPGATTGVGGAGIRKSSLK
jgi:hypothetical protein